ncbi:MULTISPECIES: glycoside hydrolase family 15 protein [Rhodomicrobium]|uniref:glycoside hydrolase family 15 protein n=1 Tax=Rhodomicrobium TaxID=1068 RepID=UPI000B4B9B22|nr:MULTISPECIES: glycoside hydrolase family 15 protein [Rhodomicrobium]
MSTLELGIIGNCGIAALVDKKANIVWCCLPRFDKDPIFHSLLGSPKQAPDAGRFSVELEDFVSSEQSYVPNTAVLKTILHGESGSVQVTDFVPRFHWRDRAFRPQMLVRRLTPISGSPRVRIRVKPRFEYGNVDPNVTFGSNHVRYVGPGFAIRLTTDAPIDYILDEVAFNLAEPVNLILGPDETLTEGATETAVNYEERTQLYWKQWVHRLAVPSEWQDAVIRAAITLKLCNYEPTGAIVAALTTSIPEAAETERNWDYRYCWIRDALFVVRALNSLSAVRTMENYFRWIMNIVANARDSHLQPVYGVGLEQALIERTIPQLGGYRGYGPVRVGNQAYEHFQHDTYGNLVLGASQAFFDKRLLAPAGIEDFKKLEFCGEQSFALHDKPDAGMWELRHRARIHTSSSVMCWAACDRLAKIAAHLGLIDRHVLWRERADTIKATILDRAWSEKRKAYVESFGGEHLDASVLLMSEVGFIEPHNPRFISTLDQMEKVLGRGPHMMRYEAPDDFGMPKTAFNVCAFWRVDALARVGRREQARENFEALLSARNHLGLMSEDTDPITGEAWGNFPQTYSMVGIINGAMRLSRPWEGVV